LPLPDGRRRDVYVASYSSGALVRFRVGLNGGLAFRGCIADGGANSCAKLPHGSLSGAAGVAVSPDGHDVYAASQVGSVVRLKPRHGRGLTFAGCITEDAAPGCRTARRPVLSEATGVTVSPDGRDVYVAAQRDNALVRLRPGRHGSLLFAGCVAAAGAHHCARAAAPGLRGPYALAASPDGSSLYVTAARGAALSAFTRRR
jgi:DNA-binding beta-propeller fold protein YncE